MIIRNAFVRTTRFDGTEVYDFRAVQWDDVDVQERLSTGPAPTLHKVFYDDAPDSDYQRGDLVTVVGLLNQGVLPPAPFHVWRAQSTGGPLPATEVACIRLDILMEEATLFRAITDLTPGSTVAPEGTDPIRKQPVVFSDSSHGRGHSLGANDGYLPAQPVVVGILEQKEYQEQTPSGLMVYNNDFLFFEPPLQLKRFDVIVRTTGQRGEVGETISIMQQNGVTFATMVYLNQHQPTSPIYNIS